MPHRAFLAAGCSGKRLGPRSGRGDRVVEEFGFEEERLGSLRETADSGSHHFSRADSRAPTRP